MIFYALDVETANPDYSSICQIGISTFDQGEIIDRWKTYLNPEDYFDDFNIGIHGITPDMVKKAPIIPHIYSVLKQKLENQVVVHHMPFDRIAINRAFEKYDLEPININWLDSAKVTRRTWEDCTYTGYGLAKIAKKLGFKFERHDALEDAIVAGKIVIEAINKTGLDLLSLIDRTKAPIRFIPYSKSVSFEGNPNGPLYGENLVFTGTLMITRTEAAKLAADFGCNVSYGVNKKTTILVVGQQDAMRLNGKDKSTKHLKAEELIQKGHRIRIMTEDDFKHMVNLM